MKARLRPRAHQIIIEMGNEQDKLRNALVRIAREWNIQKTLDEYDTEKLDRVIREATKNIDVRVDPKEVKRRFEERFASMPKLPSTNQRRKTK